jgi:hypothetical protein
MFVFGYSAGAGCMAGLATEEAYVAERKNIRGLVMAGGAGVAGGAPITPLRCC